MNIYIYNFHKAITWINKQNIPKLKKLNIVHALLSFYARNSHIARISNPGRGEKGGIPIPTKLYHGR